jgi:hypothetical protein
VSCLYVNADLRQTLASLRQRLINLKQPGMYEMSQRGSVSSHHDADLRCAHTLLSIQHWTPAKPWSPQRDALQLGVQGALRGN